MLGVRRSAAADERTASRPPSCDEPPDARVDGALGRSSLEEGGRRCARERVPVENRLRRRRLAQAPPPDRAPPRTSSRCTSDRAPAPPARPPPSRARPPPSNDRNPRRASGRPRRVAHPATRAAPFPLRGADTRAPSVAREERRGKPAPRRSPPPPSTGAPRARAPRRSPPPSPPTPPPRRRRRAPASPPRALAPRARGVDVAERADHARPADRHEVRIPAERARGAASRDATARYPPAAIARSPCPRPARSTSTTCWRARLRKERRLDGEALAPAVQRRRQDVVAPDGADRDEPRRAAIARVGEQVLELPDLVPPVQRAGEVVPLHPERAGPSRQLRQFLNWGWVRSQRKPGDQPRLPGETFRKRGAR